MTIARNQAISFAERNYVRITWDQHKKIHDAFVFKGEYLEPAWPEKTMPEIIKIAFGDARMIRSMDHPVLRAWPDWGSDHAALATTQTNDFRFRI